MGRADLWRRLLGRTDEVDAALLLALRTVHRHGCALNVVDGQVRLGPYDDFADCAWPDADAWWRDYDRLLAPHEIACAKRAGQLPRQGWCGSSLRHPV